MAANDLNRPLGQDKKTPLRSSRIFMFGSLGVLAALVIGLASWIIVVDDPTGGYPQQVVELSGNMSETNKIAVSEIRPGIRPGIPETNRDSELDPQEPALFPEPDTTNTQMAGNDGEIRILDPSNASQTPEAFPEPTGNEPYRIYARPVNPDAIAGLPKIAIVVDGLGLSQTTTQEALSLLPPDITLAFAPYGNSPVTLDRASPRARP